MKVIVNVTKSFKRLAKPLLKKYSSLNKELSKLENDLIDNPQLGKPLGHNAFKIRLASDFLLIVTLIAIYDKSETASISDKELSNLINRIPHD